jgi:A/G-specific adenine glycosylase
MLQQTRVDTVQKYYARFLEAMPTVEALAAASEERVLKLWEGLGYYTRARNLRKAAQVVARDWGGQFPRAYEALRKLPGVGAYTAGAIASICFEAPVPALDGNALRILTRVTEDYRPPQAAAKEIAASLAGVYPPGRCGDFTQSLIELGATVCLPGPQPHCGLCPAKNFCLAAQHGTQGALPTRAANKERPILPITYLLLRHEGHTALERRAGPGVLKGLWAFPSLPGRQDWPAVARWLTGQGAEGVTLLSTIEGKHVFTHVEWRILCHRVQCANRPGAFTWASPEGLAEEISLPTAFRKFL